ncbi:alpha-galactosidase [Kribbella catacumbae]|uniref:alpha-galactosidase n=1 Tax=Kribbella catacumbae TaxID=460086 RepID=UPI00036198C4|nr:alpha-galactosidase [Kribbella catacumbae]
MSNAPESVPAATIHLRAAGCSLLVLADDDRLPRIRHWGADLGEQSSAGAAGIDIVSDPHSHLSGELPASEVSVVTDPTTGWFGRAGLKGSRLGRSWSTSFRTTKVELNGRPVAGFTEGGPGTLRIAAVDDEAALTLHLVIELLDSGLVRLRATLTNDGADFDLDELSLNVPVPSQATEILDFAGRWGMERQAQRHDFTVGTHLRESRRGRTGLDAATVVHAMEPATTFSAGEAWGVHVAWSGNHRHFAEHDSTGVRLLGGGELLLPGELQLATGESYTTPWLYASYGVGLDAVAHRFHNYLRDRPQHVSTDRLVTLNVWEAVYFDHDPERLIALADRAAEVGIERFVLDDGWFGARRNSGAGLGDWTVSADVWPDGLHPLVNAVRSHGMQFGLWFEPEMVNLDSDLARAHPDWIMAARSVLPREQRSQHVLNLSIPECFTAVHDQLVAMIAEYEIDYLKWDHNRDHLEAGLQSAGGAPTEHAQTLAVYQLLDDLKERFPALEIESCAAGGGRIDLGILERTDRVWVSDCIDPLERQRLMRWTGQLLPPELMGSHIGSPRSHTTHRTHDLSFRAATALFGHYGVEWDLGAATEDDLRELADWIAIYKKHRGLINRGNVLRGPDPADNLWLHGVVAGDRSEALYGVAAMSWGAASTPPRARLRGLDAVRRYQVAPIVVGDADRGFTPPRWWDDRTAVVSGAALESVGVQLPNLHPEHSILIHVIAVD